MSQSAPVIGALCSSWFRGLGHIDRYIYIYVYIDLGPHAISISHNILGALDRGDKDMWDLNNDIFRQIPETRLMLQFDAELLQLQLIAAGSRKLF